MLLLMLAAVATVVRAEPLCRPFNVRTGKVFGSKPLPEGDMLFYAFSSIHVLRDFCHSNVVLYLGKKIFISKDNFESSLPPLIIPKSMKELSNNVFAYLRGGPLPRTKIFFSDNGGFSFQYLASESLDRLKGTLGGIFHFYSLSQVGILEVKNKLGSFHYMEHPLNHSAGIPFKYSDSLDVIIKPGQRGFLVLWSQTSLLVSPNSGQIMETVQLWKGKTVVTPDISNIGINIHSLASNAYELALLTRENVVYYGNQGYLGTTLVQLPEQPVWSEEAGISFTDTGMLEVLTPVADPRFPAFDFQKCIVNVQYVLNNASLQIEPCNVEFLDSTMVEQMFTIDMNSKLELSALMIPRPGKIPIPLEIELKQQQHQNRADLNFTTSIKRNAISSITVDIADKTIACVDLKPLSTLISVGCDKTKKILVQNKISACSMGILNPVELQRNYTYTIEKEAYRPVNYDAQAQADLLVYYQYKELGCPRLVYYDKPWKPVVEMWKDGVLEEIMDAEYVITEVNGITTYSYSLTAATANCRSQPQNWSTFQSDLHFLYQGSLWNRENYVSCHEDNKDNPLLWPEVEYQILGGQTDNRVIFGQRNGIYTFILSVVDPYYSYCSLDTMFSVYVDGALPMAFFSPELSITVLVFTALLSVWLAYAIPKELSTERGQRLTNFCSWLFQGCLGLCRCSWLWDRPKLWLRSRRVGDQPERIRSTQTN
ncbi:cation channel sperm-associated auxiliary subunit delta isoform X1 [Peromyscus californicus insignis]|uniref:cation channel sperm-associated auxiliary subunit delta isoform X1 n=1 Tax=Peromyscus californicus insignis TaxID=564181 RepID=UPI0022A73B25|nr:cation channel sperm-associated auxiliary subunit delta isoform X1 [Peromyscus californicus insignis]